MKHDRKLFFDTVVGTWICEVRGAEHPTLLFMRRGSRDNVGVYAFWVAVCNKADQGIIGRVRVGLSAGDRFDRMFVEERRTPSWEARFEYAKMLHQEMGGGEKIRYIRPATISDVKKWVASHQDDCKSAHRLLCNGRWREFKKGKLV